MLAGCATSGNLGPVVRSLPPAPSYLKPVEVADPTEGEDALDVAARERAGRLKANGVIRRASAWYLCVKAGYAGKKKCK